MGTGEGRSCKTSSAGCAPRQTGHVEALACCTQNLGRTKLGAINPVWEGKEVKAEPFHFR